MVWVLPVVLASLLTVSFLGYQNAKEQVIYDSYENTMAIAQANTNKLDGWLMTQLKMIEGVNSAIAAPGFDKTQELPYMKESLKKFEHISDIYIGTTEGEMIDAAGWIPPDDYDPRVRSWYKEGLEVEEITFGSAYLDMNTKEMIVGAVTPIYHKDATFRGVFAGDVELETLTNLVKEIKVGQTGYAYLIDNRDSTVLAHPDEEKLTTKIVENNNEDIKAMAQKMMAGESDQGTYEVDGKKMLTCYAQVPSANWSLIAVVPEKEVLAQLNILKWNNIITTIIAILILALVLYFVAGGIVKPIQKLSKVSETLAQGDLTAVAEIKSRDEVGQLAVDFNTMRDKLRELIQKINQVSETVAGSAAEMAATSEETGKGSEQVSITVDELANGVTEVAETMQQTVVNVENTMRSVEVVGEGSNNILAVTEEAQERVKLGNEAVEQVVVKMNSIKDTVDDSASMVKGLGERSHEIGSIVDVITGIAEQTNLLALNAAIEAARAGEQGRGFAVVADEVRKLAEESASAAAKIANLIKGVQAETEKAVQAIQNGTVAVDEGNQVVKQSGEYFTKIDEAVSDIVGMVENTQKAIGQLESNTKEVATVVENVSSVMEESAAGTEEVSAAAQQQSASVQEIVSAAHGLSKLAEDLQKMVNAFKV